MLEYGYIAGLFFLALCIVDIRDHNKKVEEEWPDDSDQHHWHMRQKFRINLIGHYFLAILLAAMLVRNILSII